jgi:hypothetical protein
MNMHPLIQQKRHTCVKQENVFVVRVQEADLIRYHQLIGLVVHTLLRHHQLIYILLQHYHGHQLFSMAGQILVNHRLHTMSIFTCKLTTSIMKWFLLIFFFLGKNLYIKATAVNFFM